MAQYISSTGYILNPYRNENDGGYSGYDMVPVTVLQMAVGLTTFTYPNVQVFLRRLASNPSTDAPASSPSNSSYYWPYSFADCTADGRTSSADALKYLQYAIGASGPTTAQIAIMQECIDDMFDAWVTNGIGYFGDSTAFPMFVLATPTYTPITRTVSAYTSNDFSKVVFVGAGLGSKSITLAYTDFLQITNTDADGNSSTLTASGFDFDHWVTSSNLSIAASASASKQTNYAPSTSTDTITVAASGFTSNTISVTFVSNVDSTLDSITGALGADVNPIGINQYHYSDTVAISGISSGINVDVTVTGAEFSLNGGSYIPAGTDNIISSGSDNVRLRITSSSSYSTGVTATVSLDAGDNVVSDSITVTTEPNPDQPITGGTLISFGHATGSIPMSDIVSFFAGAPISGVYTPPTNIGSYYQGGVNVPPLTGNSAIPLESARPTPITFSDFRGAQTVFYLKKGPSHKYYGKNTISEGGQLVVAWYAFNTPWGTPADWEMGYGPYIKWACEYYYELSVNSYTVNAGSVTTAPRLTAATPTTWTAASSWDTVGQVGFGVEMYVSQNTEVFVTGTVTMHIRHPANTSYTLSTDVTWTLNAFGP